MLMRAWNEAKESKIGEGERGEAVTIHASNWAQVAAPQPPLKEPRTQHCPCAAHEPASYTLQKFEDAPLHEAII